MFKFTAIALFGLVAVASAGVSFNPNAESEASGLTDDLKAFAPYCIEERDFIMAQVNRKYGPNAQTLFKVVKILTNDLSDTVSKLNLEIQGKITPETPSAASIMQLLSTKESICELVETLEEHAETSFRSYVNFLASNPETAKLAATNRSNVACLTTGLVSKLALFCY